jgi:hypothetical protein
VRKKITFLFLTCAVATHTYRALLRKKESRIDFAHLKTDVAMVTEDFAQRRYGDILKAKHACAHVGDTVSLDVVSGMVAGKSTAKNALVTKLVTNEVTKVFIFMSWIKLRVNYE